MCEPVRRHRRSRSSKLSGRGSESLPTVVSLIYPLLFGYVTGFTLAFAVPLFVTWSSCGAFPSLSPSISNFIRELRGVDKVHVLGWSSGAMAEAPLYTIQQPDKVAKLILYAGNYLGKRKSAEQRAQEDAKREAEKNRYGSPADLQHWINLGT